ncbi:MAG: lytic transglycosylase [Pseudorhodobacter sp.]
MSRFLAVAMMLVLLVSCGGGRYSAPRDLDNACAIIAERPKYYRAMQATERKWGVPVPVQMAIIHQESRFIGNAKTPHRFALGIIPLGRQSSAYGYSQALDGTWEDYQAAEGGRRARRDRIEDATDFMGWYMHESQVKLGIAKADTRSQYLAYHDGHAGYARGSYRSKSWLMDIAGKVEERAQIYAAQLSTCQ